MKLSQHDVSKSNFGFTVGKSFHKYQTIVGKLFWYNRSVNLFIEWMKNKTTRESLVQALLPFSFRY
jgi:hypothetical protein